MADDFLREVLDSIALACSLSDDQRAASRRVEQQMRIKYGAASVYILRRSDADKEQIIKKVRDDYLNNVQTDDISRRHGISRATMYRLIKK